jgi:hypothetical protein
VVANRVVFYSAVMRCAKFVGAYVTACLIDMLKLSTFRTLRILQFCVEGRLAFRLPSQLLASVGNTEYECERVQEEVERLEKTNPSPFVRGPTSAVPVSTLPNRDTRTHRMMAIGPLFQCVSILGHPQQTLMPFRSSSSFTGLPSRTCVDAHMLADRLLEVRGLTIK